MTAAPAAKFQEARQKLDSWRARAAQSPFSFYSSLLCEDGGRRALEARLGPEAADAIDEFLRLALAHEAEAAPSLAGFLADFETVERSIRRDMESGVDVVRVMTVHAAKGLEAKIVFLPDTCGAPGHQHDPKIFALDDAKTGAFAIAWSPRKDADCKAVADAREAMRRAGRDEYRRLLYVALTRAEERLYIAGFHGAKPPAADCWALMIAATLASEPDVETAPAFWSPNESVLRLISPGAANPAAPARDLGAGAPAVAPAWLTRPVAPPVEAPPPIRPSSALAAADRWTEAALTPARREALRIGALTHVLLQYLPDLPPEGRFRVAVAFLETKAADLTAQMRAGLIEAALRVIDAPELAALFGPQSKAEVAVAGRVALPRGGSIEVVGRIDRIGVAADEVLVADFKTGAPCAEADIPHSYLAQMALYRAALAPLWPGKRLRMLLVWTAEPRVVALDDVRLNELLAAIEAGAAARADKVA